MTITEYSLRMSSSVAIVTLSEVEMLESPVRIQSRPLFQQFVAGSGTIQHEDMRIQQTEMYDVGLCKASSTRTEVGVMPLTVLPRPFSVHRPSMGPGYIEDIANDWESSWPWRIDVT